MHQIFPEYMAGIVWLCTGEILGDGCRASSKFVARVRVILTSNDQLRVFLLNRNRREVFFEQQTRALSENTKSGRSSIQVSTVRFCVSTEVMDRLFEAGYSLNFCQTLYRCHC